MQGLQDLVNAGFYENLIVSIAQVRYGMVYFLLLGNGTKSGAQFA